MKPNYRAIALDFIRAHPGSSGLEISKELQRRSRAARWFGADSFWTRRFGPNSYAILTHLDCVGQVYPMWEKPMPDDHLSRRYYAMECFTGARPIPEAQSS